MTIADFQIDVNDEVNQLAERIVATELRRYFAGKKPVSIKNIATEHKKWDIVLTHDNRDYRLDVKCDKYIETSNRVPFETHEVYGANAPVPSWGFNEQLEYLAVIPRSLQWIKVFRLPFLRSYVGYMLTLHSPDVLVAHYDWRIFHQPNNGWSTHGFAIPIAAFDRYLQFRNEFPVVHLEVNPDEYQGDPRLLANGRRVAA